ncbi:MAG: type I methionyl aminopeptidase [Caldisericaceae bacterium]|nr:type I methionyl aminopeptidase [Caldisericaceae bacterium]
MVELKTREEIEKIKKSGKILRQALELVKSKVKVGITTGELDKIAEEFIRSKGAIPACKGYEGFPGTMCISVNDEVVHGIPGKRKLKEGDVVSFDSCVLLDGWYSDSAITVIVGRPKTENDKKLVEVTEQALYIGIEKAVAGNRIGDISAAVQEFVEKNGFSLVREYTGHGIGRHLHEDPSVPNYGKKGTGMILKEGMCIAIEPMVCAGDYGLYTAEDGWTAITVDHSNAAHFEHTIAITKNGPEILTK